MVTTIQVSDKLLNTLKTRKMYDNETYEDVIWDLVEDGLEISEQTKKDIAQAQEEFAQGKFHTHEQVKRELGL